MSIDPIENVSTINDFLILQSKRNCNYKYYYFLFFYCTFLNKNDYLLEKNFYL